jgi:hypothetical protein
MNITYIGNIGSGKTLAALQQSLILYINYQPLFLDFKVFSNISLEFPEEENIVFEFFNGADDTDKLINGVVLYDEMWKDADARLSTTKKNKFLSQWSIITRKRKLHLLTTEQSEKQLDVRIRRIMHYIGYPYQFNINTELTQKRGELTFDNTGVLMIPVNQSPGQPWEYSFENKFFWNFYDTYEEPKSFELSYDEQLEVLERKILADKLLESMVTKSEYKSVLMDKYSLSAARSTIILRVLQNHGLIEFASA